MSEHRFYASLTNHRRSTALRLRLLGVALPAALACGPAVATVAAPPVSEEALPSSTSVASSAPSAVPPPEASSVALAPPSDSPETDLLVPSAHRCRVSYRKRILTLRCALAHGDGPGLLDVASTDGSVVGGSFAIEGDELVWTVDDEGRRANSYYFDDGAWELGLRTRDQHFEWLAVGTYKPKGEADTRHVMSCCLTQAKDAPIHCFGQQLESESKACASAKGCDAQMTCIEKRLANRRAKSCKAPDFKDCFMPGANRR